MTRLIAAIALLTVFGSAAPAQKAAPPDGIATLLGRLEQVLREGPPERYLDLLAPSADRAGSLSFAGSVVVAGITRAAVRERDRIDLPGTLPGDGYRLMVEVMIESGVEARVSTWRLDVRRRSAGTVEDWGIVAQNVMSTLQGLHRLALNPRREVAVRELVVRAEGLKLAVPEGLMFVAEAGGWPTSFVVLGRGEMTFAPAAAAERGQMKILGGNETLQTSFDTVFVRVNPGDAQAHVVAREMTERPVDPRDVKRADDLFRQEVVKSFGLDLGDLSPDNWSLLPLPGDFLAEIHTRRFDTLTYIRAVSEIEDISLFDRKKRHNLSVYQSQAHLDRYTRFYNEDDQAEYRVISYGVDIAFNPARRTIAGQASLNLEIAASSASTLTLNLADSLAVQSVVSAEFGRLLSVRVRGRDNLVVDLPQALARGSRLHLVVAYAGPIEPQSVDREALEPQIPDVRRNPLEEQVEVPLESSYLYSNRSNWYPAPVIGGYATARIAVTVPEPWSVLASGELVSAVRVAEPSAGVAAFRQFSFRANEPLRYLAFLVTRMAPPRGELVSLKSAVQVARLEHLPGVHHDEVNLTVRTNARQGRRGPEIQKAAGNIIRFYTSIVGDYPYPSLSVATVERPLPGGHSPGYLVVVAVPGPGLPVTYADDPGVLPEFPDFFLAHEIAHQWWGQAVGWKNYHEQWLSEAFAQYFAALYAERSRGRGAFGTIVRRLRDAATSESGEGPIFLGYRVGHFKGDSRIFRAVVYDKGAMVLHMLRRLMGDDAFFGGLRRFYDQWRFKKAGTDDLRHAMEEESGLDLTRFFDQWVLGDALPQVAVSERVVAGDGAQDVEVEFEQVGAVFDVPVTVTVETDRGPATALVVKLTERHAVVRIPVRGAVRKIEVNRDEAALGTFTVRGPGG